MNVVTLLSPFFTFSLTCALIPQVTPYLIRARLFGLDLGKKGTKSEAIQIPEAAGLVAGTVFLTALLLQIPLSSALGEGSSLPPLQLISSLFSILFMLMLGFTDDVLDWPWRYKLLLPLLGSIPVCACYDG